LGHKFKNDVLRPGWLHNHQRPGVECDAVIRLESLRPLLALAAIRDLDVIQFDITSAYLHRAPRKGYWVWRLKKGLYGLVQAGRTWDEQLNSHVVSEVLAATPKDPAVYVKNTSDWEDFVGGGFRVDDLVGIGSGKGLGAFVNVVDAKHGITEQGGHRCLVCLWSAIARRARFQFRKGNVSFRS